MERVRFMARQVMELGQEFMRFDLEMGSALRKGSVEAAMASMWRMRALRTWVDKAVPMMQALARPTCSFPGCEEPVDQPKQGPFPMGCHRHKGRKVLKREERLRRSFIGSTAVAGS